MGPKFTENSLPLTSALYIPPLQLNCTPGMVSTKMFGAPKPKPRRPS